MFLMKLSFNLKGIYLINLASSLVIVKNVKSNFNVIFLKCAKDMPNTHNLEIANKT